MELQILFFNAECRRGSAELRGVCYLPFLVLKSEEDEDEILAPTPHFLLLLSNW